MRHEEAGPAGGTNTSTTPDSNEGAGMNWIRGGAARAALIVADAPGRGVQ